MCKMHHKLRVLSLFITHMRKKLSEKYSKYYRAKILFVLNNTNEVEKYYKVQVIVNCEKIRKKA